MEVKHGSIVRPALCIKLRALSCVTTSKTAILAPSGGNGGDFALTDEGMMMTTTYEITGFHKHIERDNWENGCVGDCQSFFIPMHIKADSLSNLKSQILSFVGAPDNAMECDACDEIGRIDIQKTENDDGFDPSIREESAFKAGEIDLWLACYTCYVERVERETVSAK